MNGSRVKYFDSIKLVASLWVFTTHFIAAYYEGLFLYWDKFPLNLLLKGITGKLAVSMFAVILGYFAFEEGIKLKKGVIEYSVKRYMYFVLAGLLINFVYGIWGTKIGVMSSQVGIKDILITSFSLGEQIFPTFWCIKPFFIGSVISFINGRHKVDIGEVILEIVICLFMDELWISICLLGNIFALIVKKQKVCDMISKETNQAILFFLIFLLVKRNESDFTYFIDGICSAGFLLLVTFNTKLRALLENRIMAAVGKNCMTIYLIHVIVYSSLGKAVFNNMNLSYGMEFCVSYFVCLVTVIVLSYPVSYFISCCNEGIIKMWNLCYQKVSNSAIKENL